MTAVDWHGFSLERLADAIRESRDAPDGERTIWAFEQALRVARIDEQLLGHVLVAATCLLARSSGSSPRTVLEAYFRRSVTDEEWRARYLPLLG